MAYGVKYRLEFSDVLGNGKKVEILKKDYTGKILPLIGSASPVKISWQSSDDFYKPIIGSKCTLSLLVTDEVSYDDFYRFDEREYKVVVYYAKSKGEIYADRVNADGGIVESIECVDNVLPGFNTISEFYKNRVLLDDGIIESLSCFSNAIDDSIYYEWNEYWSGFLVVDRYKEKLTSTPFGITINAYDGLGTLTNFDAPIGYNNNLSPIILSTAQRISAILDNLDLNLDIHISTDLKFNLGGFSEENFEGFPIFQLGSSELKEDFSLYSAKEMLEIILTYANCRIFQSYNKWHISENTNIFDNYVKDEIYNELNSTGVVPTGIRDRITSQLNSTKKEFIDFRTYDKDFISLGTKRIDILYSNTKSLKPIKNDLSKEYLQPISKIITNGINVKSSSTFYNAGFEYGSFGWVTTSYSEIATDDVSYKGRRSMKLSASAPVFGLTLMFSYSSPPFDPGEISYDDFTFKLKYYIKLINTSPFPVTATLQYRIWTTDDYGVKYFSDFDNEFVTYTAINDIETTNLNSFISYSKSLTNEGLSFLTTLSTTLNIEIYNTQCSSPDYETTYFDNVFIDLKKDEIEELDINVISNLTNSVFTTSSKTRKSRQDKLATYYRTRDNYGTALYKDLTYLINQNIANDFREFVARYEGTFINNKIQPLSIHHKIWFYWNENDFDPESTIIDGLTYDLKNSYFKVKSHLPNNDDDVLTNLIIK